MIVIDSSVLIDWLRKTKTPQTDQLVGFPPRDVLIGDVVLLEILQGAVDDRHARNLEIRLRRYDIVAMLNGDLAARTASNYRHLRRLGITIRKTLDLVIATYCIENDCVLLQRDRDFAPMAEHLGLRLA